jgi:hypothetical protein
MIATEPVSHFGAGGAFSDGENVEVESGRHGSGKAEATREADVGGELEPRRGHRASPACHRETTQPCEGQRFHNVTNRVRP